MRNRISRIELCFRNVKSASPKDMKGQQYRAWPQMLLEDSNFIEALTLLAFFDGKSEMPLNTMLEMSKTRYIPRLLDRLQLLESRKLLRRVMRSNRAFWEITPTGCAVRDKMKEIMSIV